MNHNLRHFEGRFPLDLPPGIFSNDVNPLIKFPKGGGAAMYTSRPYDKIDMLKRYKSGDQIVFPWSGKFSTDVFEIEERMIDALILLIEDDIKNLKTYN